LGLAAGATGHQSMAAATDTYVFGTKFGLSICCSATVAAWCCNLNKQLDGEIEDNIQVRGGGLGVMWFCGSVDVGPGGRSYWSSRSACHR
jgi:hypothetical protein